ncbi:DUF4232 domain-containing protein [Streptomyces sp. NPDC059002]|uniref:DUF4232 domain-containing protein n=1 Tax=Streptomyces sp. NPDC059002 TaxID=3346690 RepID=UPI0036B13908
MKIKHASKTLLAGLALLGSLSLTACNGDDGTDTTGSGSDSVPSASAGQEGGSGTGGSGGSSDKGTGGEGGGSSDKGSGGGSGDGTAAGTGSNENGKVGICRSDELEVSAVDNTTDKEEGVVTVVFKNGGGRDCTVSGFAGVDLKTAAGDSLSAERNEDKPPTDVIKDGESAAFNILFPVNNSGGSGVRVSKILVTPPNETKTVTVAWPAGSLPAENPDSQALTGPIRISPVGKVSDSPRG